MINDVLSDVFSLASYNQHDLDQRGVDQRDRFGRDREDIVRQYGQAALPAWERWKTLLPRNLPRLPTGAPLDVLDSDKQFGAQTAPGAMDAYRRRF